MIIFSSGRGSFIFLNSAKFEKLSLKLKEGLAFLAGYDSHGRSLQGEDLALSKKAIQILTKMLKSKESQNLNVEFLHLLVKQHSGIINILKAAQTEDFKSMW